MSLDKSLKKLKDFYDERKKSQEEFSPVYKAWSQKVKEWEEHIKPLLDLAHEKGDTDLYFDKGEMSLKIYFGYRPYRTDEGEMISAQGPQLIFNLLIIGKIKVYRVPSIPTGLLLLNERSSEIVYEGTLDNLSNDKVEELIIDFIEWAYSPYGKG